MTAWPDGLPFFDLRSGYSAQPGVNVRRTPMDAGEAKARRRFTSTPSVVTGMAYMTREEAQRFEAFYRDTLFDGALRFTKTDGQWRRRNLMVQSEDFSAGWAASNVAVASDVAIDPNGTNTADRIGSSTPTNGVRFLDQSASVAVGGPITMSVCFRRDPISTTDWAAVAMSDGADVDYATFNVSSGALGSVIGSTFSLTPRIRSIGGSWHRCSISVAAASAANLTMRILAASGAGSLSTVNGADVFAWGAQLETAPAFTTYEPVGASYPATHVTRGGEKTYRIVEPPRFDLMGLGHGVPVTLEVIP